MPFRVLAATAPLFAVLILVFTGFIPARPVPFGRSLKRHRDVSNAVQQKCFRRGESASPRSNSVSCAFATVCIAAQSGPPAAPDLDKKDAELSGHRLELRGMEDTIEASQEQRRQIEAEIASIRSRPGEAHGGASRRDPKRQRERTEDRRNRGQARHADRRGGCDQAFARKPPLGDRRGPRLLAADGAQAAAGAPRGAGRHARRDQNLDAARCGAAADAQRNRSPGLGPFGSPAAASIDRHRTRDAFERALRNFAPNVSVSRRSWTRANRRFPPPNRRSAPSASARSTLPNRRRASRS